VWDYCAKSELHPAAAGLEVLLAISGRTQITEVENTGQRSR